MHGRDLEDLTLLLVRDEEEPAMRLDRWLLSYPVAYMAEISCHQRITDQRSILQTALNAICSKNTVVVAHGAGVSGFLAWLYLADMNTQRRVRNVILVSPLQGTLPDDAGHSLQRVRCHCPAALVIDRQDLVCPEDWAKRQARLQDVRLLIVPEEGRLSGNLQGWQRGMKLMQEILRSQ